MHVAFIVQYMTLDDEPVNFLEEVFGAQLMALTKQCEQPDNLLLYRFMPSQGIRFFLTLTAFFVSLIIQNLLTITFEQALLLIQVQFRMRARGIAFAKMHLETIRLLSIFLISFIKIFCILK